jgi:hypothetical protein
MAWEDVCGFQVSVHHPTHVPVADALVRHPQATPTLDLLVLLHDVADAISVVL